MSKTTKVIAGLGIVASLGVAALPLGATQAVACPVNSTEAPTPQCASTGLTMSITDGVSIALENQELTRNGNGDITAITGNPTAASTILGTAIAGGPAVYLSTGTKVTAASSSNLRVSVMPTDLVGITDSSEKIEWSGTAVADNATSSYNIRYFNEANTAAPLVASATTVATTGEPGSETTAYATGTQIMNGTQSGTKTAYTAYDVAAKAGLAAQDYTGTITYIVQGAE